MLKEEGTKNFIRYCKNNMSNKYRLNSYHNYNDLFDYMSFGKDDIKYDNVRQYNKNML